MCARANRGSVPDSLHALIGSLVMVASAVLVLVLALTTAPVRLVRTRPTKHGKPAGIGRIEVQVHLSHRERVRDIERSCRAALRRAARTWAPFPLPLDRVEVLSSAPPLGKIDIYERWAPARADDSYSAGSLVVVTIGTTIDARDLTPDEIAGALAGQIERLVIDRYQREHPKEVAVAQTEPATTVGVVVRMRAANEITRDPTPHPENVTDISSVRALIADIKKSQPLVPAGSSANGVHLDQDPA
jgi:hypothetical protein